MVRYYIDCSKFVCKLNNEVDKDFWKDVANYLLSIDKKPLKIFASQSDAILKLGKYLVSYVGDCICYVDPHLNNIEINSIKRSKLISDDGFRSRNVRYKNDCFESKGSESQETFRCRISTHQELAQKQFDTKENNVYWFLTYKSVLKASALSRGVVANFEKNENVENKKLLSKPVNILEMYMIKNDKNIILDQSIKIHDLETGIVKILSFNDLKRTTDHSQEYRSYCDILKKLYMIGAPLG